MKGKKLVATWMFFLMLSLPMVTAVSLSGHGFGQDTRRDYVRGEDQVTLVAELSGLSQDPNPQHVSFIPAAGLPQTFESCPAGTNACTLALPQQTFASRPHQFLIRYDDGVETDEFNIEVFVDDVGAQVTKVESDKGIVKPTDTVKLTFDVSDEACSAVSCNGKCTGVKQINVFEGSLTNPVQTFAVTDDQCAFTAEKTFVASDLTDGNTGNLNLIFQAVDEFDNPAKSEEFLSLIVDDTPPGIGIDDFSLRNVNGEINFYKSAVANVKFSFILTEPVFKVFADLSMLNPSLGVVDDLSCSTLSCEKTILLNLPAFSEGNLKLQVPITLIDELGNVGSFVLTKDVEVDLSPPEFDEASTTAASIDGVLGYGTATNLSITLDDDGAGLDPDNVFVSFAGINSNFPSVQALSCVENICLFPHVPPASEGQKQLTLLGKTSDAIGNEMGANTLIDVFVDTTPPKLVDMGVGFEDTEFTKGDEESEDNLTQLPSRGDTLRIQVILEEPTDIFAYGDFTKINDERVIEGSCEGGIKVDDFDPELPTPEELERFSPGIEQFSRGLIGRDGSSGGSSSGGSGEITLNAGEILCEFDVEITKSGSVIGEEVRLFFEDPFGNSLMITPEIPNIFGLNEDESPNFWTNEVICSPELLDRAVGELIEQQMFCMVQLTPLGEAQEIVQLELDECEEPQGFLEDAELRNAQSLSPMIDLTFERDQYETNRLNVTCTLNIDSIIGEEIITNTEQENVSIPVLFFEEPLDTPDQEVIDKIEDIKEQWGEGFGSVIRWLGIIEKLATRICGLLNNFSRAKALLSQKAGAIPDAVGGCGARIADEAANQGFWATKQKLTPFCDFVNCRALQGSSQEGKSKWKFMGKQSERVANLKTNLVKGEGIGHITGIGSGLVENMGGDPASYLDIKNNMYLSAATFCVPGIIRSLEKYRQIQCYHAYCLQDLIVDASIPPSVCENQKSYQTCKFFIGPLFKAFPFVAFIDFWLDSFKAVLSDPFVAIGTVANLACPSCEQTSWNACRVIHVVNLALDVWQDVEGIIDDFGSISDDYCEEVDTSPRSSSGRSSFGSSGRGLVGR